MSINWQRSRLHSLNRSTSKNLPAFDKTPRFTSTPKPFCDSFYNISKNIANGKGMSLGMGKKISFGDKNGFPSPLQYEIRSTFDEKNKYKKGIKISLGRQSLKYGGIFQKSQTPDPSHYTPKDPRINTPKSGYSIRPKLKEIQPSFVKNPGPGQYKNYSTITATGIYSISNLTNCVCPKIKLSKAYDPHSKENNPGPGQYQRRKQNLNQTGHYFISKYGDSRCRTFSKSSDKNSIGKQKAQLPGPGAYNYYSQFGARTKLL